MNRRDLLRLSLAAPALHLSAQSRKRRTVVIMMDGFGLEYYESSAMPTLKKWAAEGVFVRAGEILSSEVGGARPDHSVRA